MNKFLSIHRDLEIKMFETYTNNRYELAKTDPEAYHEYELKEGLWWSYEYGLKEDLWWSSIRFQLKPFMFPLNTFVSYYSSYFKNGLFDKEDYAFLFVMECDDRNFRHFRL